EATLWAMDTVDRLLDEKERREEAARKRREAMPPAQTTWEAVRRIMHKRGKQLEQATGSDWTDHRAEIKRRYSVRSTNDLTLAQLRKEAERIGAVLVEEGVGLSSKGV